MTPEQLRNSILQMAIEGKLTEQRPEDGNAADLLKEIQAEKAKLVKEGVIKKEKPLPEIAEDEIPFEVPENWTKAKFGDVINLLSGTDFKPNEYNDTGIGTVYITGASCISENGVIKNRWTDKPKNLAFKGDVLLVCKGSGYGKTVICDVEQAHIARQIMSVKKTELLDMKFVKCYLDKSFTQLKEKGQGVIPGIDRESVLSLPLALPPLAEQKRIVSRLEKILPLVDDYEKAYNELQELNKAFPGKLKNSLLQMAVQGKLTDQRPEDGNAADLLKEIQAEKAKLVKDGVIKKEKPLPEIAEDEIPFEIPDNWCWCRLKDVCTKLVDGDHNPPKGLPYSTDYIMASSQNINDDSLVDMDRVRFLSKEVFEKENLRTNAEKDDIFFTSVGALGRSCVYKGGKNICFQRSVSVIRTLIFPYYLKVALDAPYYQQIVLREATGTAQKGFYLNQLAKTLIPVPPFAEQKRIVAKLEQLLPLCDTLAKAQQ